MRTDQLDGETDWKLRQSVKLTQGLKIPELFQIKIEFEEPSKEIYSFYGRLRYKEEVEVLDLNNTMWMNTVLATGQVLGMVIYTGKENRAIMNTSPPKNKIGIFDLEVNTYAKWLLSLSFCASIFFTCKRSVNGRIDINIIRFVVIFSSIIPISLKTSVEFARYLHAYMIKKDMPSVIVRNSNIPEELGRISYLLSDKTGTLTKNEMIMKKIHLGTVSYSQETFLDLRNELNDYFKEDTGTFIRTGKRVFDLCEALSVCHNVTPVREEKKVTYQASSPDEVAIIKWCESIGFTLLDRKTNLITVKIKKYQEGFIDEELNQSNSQEKSEEPLQNKNNEIESNKLKEEKKEDFLDKNYEILEIFPFSSETKRMGIIVKSDDKYSFFLKGADVIMKRFVKANDWLDEETGNLASLGLRTLVIAKRELTEEEYLNFKNEYKKGKLNKDVSSAMALIENNLVPLGLTGVEDLLQDNAKITLERLRDADIRIWMITGDKVETATSIAISTHLFQKKSSYLTVKEMKKEDGLKILNDLNSMVYDSLIIDGQSIQIMLDFYRKEFISSCAKLKSFVGCRCSPTQKAQLTRYLGKITNKRVAAIGDGGNDVSMITEAHLGFGIVGKEGNQASLSADFSLSCFQEVLPLLLWHGRRTYKATSKLAHLIIHRGTVLFVMQAIFCSLFLYSPISLYQGMLLMGYATIYTFGPIFSTVLASDTDKTTCLRFPELYKDLVSGSSFGNKRFLTWFFVSFYQGGIIMLLNLTLFENELLSIIALTFSSLVVNEILMVLLVTYSINKPVILSTIISLLIFCGSFILLSDVLVLPERKALFVVKVLGINLIAIIVQLLFTAWSKFMHPPAVKKIKI